MERTIEINEEGISVIEVLHLLGLGVELMHFDRLVYVLETEQETLVSDARDQDHRHILRKLERTHSFEYIHTSHFQPTTHIKQYYITYQTTIC